MSFDILLIKDISYPKCWIFVHDFTFKKYGNTVPFWKWKIDYKIHIKCLWMDNNHFYLNTLQKNIWLIHSKFPSVLSPKVHQLFIKIFISCYIFVFYHCPYSLVIIFYHSLIRFCLFKRGRFNGNFNFQFLKINAVYTSGFIYSI